jgi:hypothetical protein
MAACFGSRYLAGGVMWQHPGRATAADRQGDGGGVTAGRKAIVACVGVQMRS